MNRLSWKAGKHLLGLTFVSGLIASVSCAHNDSSLFVYSVMAPGGDCTYKADPSQAFLPSGVIDVAFLAAYRPTVLVGNQLVEQGDTEKLRTETSRIAIQGAVVTVEDSDGRQLDSFTTLSAGIANPANGSSPGFGLASITLVSPDVITGLRTGTIPGKLTDGSLVIPPGGTKRLVVRFKVFGQTLGGQSIESNESQFPVNACNGCLVYFPPGSNNPSNAFPQPNCLGTGEAADLAVPCVIGQDEAIDCRLCADSKICQPGGG